MVELPPQTAKLSGGFPLAGMARRHAMKEVLPGMQTADMNNAEVEEEERLTAEKREKADQMEVGNEKRKEKVIKKKTLKERKGESERMEDVKTGEKLPTPATAVAADTAGSGVAGKRGRGRRKRLRKERKLNE